MHTAEVVIREVQGASGLEIVQLLGKGVGQSRKPSHHHSHGQVLPFNVTRTDFLLIRVSLNDLGYNFEDWTWGVFCRAVMLPVIAVQLDKLREVHVRTKGILNCLNVEPEAVCGDLHSLCETLRQVINECARGSSRTLANGKTGNKFCNWVNGHENPSIAKFGGVFFAASLLFLVHKAPNLIGLDKVTLDTAHLCIKHLRAFLSGQDRQLQDGIAVQICEPFCAADRAALNQTRKGLKSGALINFHVADNAGIRFGKCCGAGRTAVTLDSTLAVDSEFLNCGVLAFNARHGLFLWIGEGEKPYTCFGSEVRLTPRFGLAPFSVRAENGAVTYSIKSGWWFYRDFHGLSGEANCDFYSPHVGTSFAESPVTAGLFYLLPKSVLLTMPSSIPEYVYQEVIQNSSLIFTVFGADNSAIFVQSLKGLMYQSRRVGIFAEIVAFVFQNALYIRCDYPTFNTGNNAQNHVSESHSDQSVKRERFLVVSFCVRFFLNRGTQRFNELLQSANLNCPVIALLNCVGEITLGSFQGNFVGVHRHN
jgi:hypothetical protein